MKTIRRAKRRIYTPRRDAWMRWQAAVSRFSKGLNTAVLQRLDAERDLAQRMADAFRKDLMDTLYAKVVRPEVSLLLAGDTRGPWRHVGVDPGAPEGDRTAVTVLSAPDKRD